MSVFVHKDFQEQLAILENRNMKINNREKSIRTLQVVSYYKIKEFAHHCVIVQGKKEEEKKVKWEITIQTGGHFEYVIEYVIYVIT